MWVKGFGKWSVLSVLQCVLAFPKAPVFPLAACPCPLGCPAGCLLQDGVPRGAYRGVVAVRNLLGARIFVAPMPGLDFSGELWTSAYLQP